MKINMASPIIARSQPESPSLYSIKMNPTYTSAEPVSFSARMISIGIMTVAATIRKSLSRVSLNEARLIMNASSRDVLILETSAG